MKWCLTNKLLIFKFLVILILLMLFSWQSYLAVKKFLTYSTRISISNLDDGSIFYPSISVCKNYLDGLSAGVLENISMPIGKKIDILQKNFWGREKQIYFLSHSEMFNATFPCNTLNGATEQGKPCSFPAYDKGNLHKKCIPGATSNFCYTRTHDNFSVFTTNTGAEYWGYCSDQCDGEVPRPDSEYNLAWVDSQLFSTAWSDDLYDLRQYEAGYCVTYDPPMKSNGGISNGLYFLLGQKSLIRNSNSNYMMYSFDVYLHDKVIR